MCWEMGCRGLSTVSVCEKECHGRQLRLLTFDIRCPAVSKGSCTQVRLVSAVASDMHVLAAVVTYLPFNVPKIDPQFLQKRRLPVISLCPKCRYPACPQSPLLSHAPTDALPAEAGRRPEPASARV